MLQLWAVYLDRSKEKLNLNLKIKSKYVIVKFYKTFVYSTFGG